MKFAIFAGLAITAIGFANAATIAPTRTRAPSEDQIKAFEVLHARSPKHTPNTHCVCGFGCSSSVGLPTHYYPVKGQKAKRWCLAPIGIDKRDDEGPGEEEDELLWTVKYGEEFPPMYWDEINGESSS